jgi:hypothetical protein
MGAMQQRADQYPLGVLDPAMRSQAGGLLGGFTGSTTPKAGIRAYHGSPHDFEAFDMSKIGTGEGAQAYGHGLYFAENPQVAEQYKNNLSNSAVEIAGKKTVPQPGSPEDIALAHLEDAFYTQSSAPYAKAYQDLNRKLGLGGEPAWPMTDKNRSDLEAAAKVLGDWQEKGAKPVSAGKMYEVNINADPEHFLDWDKPLYQQGPRAAAAFKNITGMELGPPTVATGAPDAGQFIRSMERMKGAENVSAALNEAGIPGIKYLDQGSRNAAGQTHNYVVFNDRLIDIVRKYGIAGLIAGGVHHFSTTPVDHDPYAQ